MTGRNYELHRKRLTHWWPDRLINASDAARIITQVHESTVRRWIKNGWTSFGLSLDVTVRKGHLVIPQGNAHYAREFLERTPLLRSDSSSQHREEFRLEAKVCSLLKPRTRYSRSRDPKLKSPHP